MERVASPGIADPDDFYQELIDSQRDMSDESAALMNAKLVLILANHIADRGVLRDAIRRAGGRPMVLATVLFGWLVPGGALVNGAIGDWWD